MAYLYKGRNRKKKFYAKTNKLPDARIILRYLGAGLVIVFLSDRLGRCCGARFQGQLRGELKQTHCNAVSMRVVIVPINQSAVPNDQSLKQRAA